MAAAKLKAKAEGKAAEAEKKKLQDEKAKLSPLQMFRTEEYGEWDESGIPTRDAKGEEVTKTRRKKLTKDWERQKKLHDGWLASQQDAGKTPHTE
jgi:cysteinyl-tRNA synthetase